MPSARNTPGVSLSRPCGGTPHPEVEPVRRSTRAAADFGGVSRRHTRLEVATPAARYVPTLTGAIRTTPSPPGRDESGPPRGRGATDPRGRILASRTRSTSRAGVSVCDIGVKKATHLCRTPRVPAPVVAAPAGPPRAAPVEGARPARRADA
ncbi:uncharacterized protein [Dermacentor albipictus]|uniref:uncharacterized protein n=1 Tax=Dermacentor albipictus TaxID=60249 RepID=UPI0031FC3A6A